MDMKKLFLSGIFLFNYLSLAKKDKALTYPSSFEVCVPANSPYNVYFLVARENDPVAGPQHIFHLDKYTHSCQPVSVDNEELVNKNDDLKDMYLTSVQAKQNIRNAKNPYAEDKFIIYESSDLKKPSKGAIKLKRDTKYEIHIEKRARGKKPKCPSGSLCACNKQVCVELTPSGRTDPVIR